MTQQLKNSAPKLRMQGSLVPRIKILGVGGSGSNTISRIAKFNVHGIELIALNTDAQSLHFTKVENKILLGKETTKGLGAGMDVLMGKRAAEESRSEIVKALEGADMVFITSGMGGGTGSGAGPIVAEIAKELGILTVCVVTSPFFFEGEQRNQIAKDALRNLQSKTDALLVISNDNLLKVIDEKTTVSNAFEICDDILKQAVQGIIDLILGPGIISLDFASVSSILRDSGQVLFGIGKAQGENRAVEAAKKAINSPLLNFSINKAKGILFNISGKDITLNEIKEAAKTITEHGGEKAKIIFGATKDNSLKKGEIKVILIATHNS